MQKNLEYTNTPISMHTSFDFYIFISSVYIYI